VAPHRHAWIWSYLQIIFVCSVYGLQYRIHVWNKTIALAWRELAAWLILAHAVWCQGPGSGASGTWWGPHKHRQGRTAIFNMAASNNEHWPHASLISVSRQSLRLEMQGTICMQNIAAFVIYAVNCLFREVWYGWVCRSPRRSKVKLLQYVNIPFGCKPF